MAYGIWHVAFADGLICPQEVRCLIMIYHQLEITPHSLAHHITISIRESSPVNASSEVGEYRWRRESLWWKIWRWSLVEGVGEDDDVSKTLTWIMRGGTPYRMWGQNWSSLYTSSITS